MNFKGKRIKKVIDNYYEAKTSSTEENYFQRYQIDEVEEKFNKAMEKMDVVNNAAHEIDVNTFQIIAEGESIKVRRREKKEFIMFLVLAACILFVVVSLSILVSMKIFIYLQVALITIMPFSIIPIAVIAKKGEKL